MGASQQAADFVVTHERGCVISLAVSPRASANRVELAADGSLRVRLTAPPVDGAANAALLKVLATILNVPRSGLTITSGAQARQKRVLAQQVCAEDARAALQRAVGRRL
ncbi:MAG: DUF167 domain-containing protein [Thermomicrobiales bacterium]|nr:DUF167 domain-containing protein [Thermomicrobiales bacterium]